MLPSFKIGSRNMAQRESLFYSASLLGMASMAQSVTPNKMIRSVLSLSLRQIIVLSVVDIPIHFEQALEVEAEQRRCFSGSDITSSCKMKLKNASNAQAILKHPSQGPYFGDDLVVTESKVLLRFGHTFDSVTTRSSPKYRPREGCFNTDWALIAFFSFML